MRIALPAYVIALILLRRSPGTATRQWRHALAARRRHALSPEMMKLALPLMLAWYFARNEGSLRLRDFATAR
jgi:rod shape determining protein RodA